MEKSDLRYAEREDSPPSSSVIPSRESVVARTDGIECLAVYSDEETCQTVSVTESETDLACQSLTIDQRNVKALIENSSFPGANVGSQIQTQQHITYKDCIINYGSNAELSEDFNKEFENVYSHEAPGTPKESRSKSCPSTVSNSHGAGCHPSRGYTRLSEKIFFYNVEPLRKRSRVYRGKQKHASNKWRDIAVKLVPHTERNLKEIEFLLNLEGHPNIVKIIESHEIFGHIREIYIAMELCSKNLREYVCDVKNSVDFSIVASYSKQLLNGLTHIHSHSIIHGDLKPDNILFSQNMKYIKISDFGLSEEALDEDYSKDCSSSLPGTDGYRAPEIYIEPPELSTASDVFSIGVVIFYLITFGRHPFGDKPHDWGYNIRHSKNRDLSLIYDLEVSPDAKINLFDLIGSALRREASTRPAALDLLCHKFFAGISCEIHATPDNQFSFDSMSRMNHVQILKRSSSQSPFMNDDRMEQHQSNTKPQEKHQMSRNLSNNPHSPLFVTSGYSSSLSSHSLQSQTSPEAYLQWRVADLEYKFSSLTRYLDTRAAGADCTNPIFNSYPRSANFPYPSHFTPPPPREQRFGSIPYANPMTHTQSSSSMEWFAANRTRTPRRQASMRGSRQTTLGKNCFERTDSFRYDGFRFGDDSAIAQSSVPKPEPNESSDTKGKKSRKPRKISMLKKFLFKKDK